MAARGSAVQLGLDDLGTPLVDAAFTVVDLETTGLDPERDRITEIGAVRARGGDVLGELATFVDPGTPIPPAVTAITGIRDRDVVGAPSIEGVLPSLLEFLRGGVFVAHNARFDLGFLRAALARAGHDRLETVVVDTALLARRLVRDEVRDVRLATLAAHFRSPVAPDHRALTDARATLHVLHALIERSSAYGVATVEDLVELGRARSDRTRKRIPLIAGAPTAPGVYRFLDRDERALYIGTATDLARRLRTYFGQDPRRSVLDLVRATERVTWTVTPTAIEAAVREVRELQARRPRHNRRSTRPQAISAVALTREPFPRLAVVRDLEGAHRRVVGPVPGRRTAERAIEAVLAVHALRECRERLRVRQDHDACILKDLHRCGAPCDGSQTPEAYEAIVGEVEAALDDPGTTLAELERRMLDEAGRDGFERAAVLREARHALVRLVTADRRWRLLTGVERLVAARPDGDAVEVVELHRGRLVVSARLERVTADGSDRASLLDALASARAVRERAISGLADDDAPWERVADRAPRREDAEEVALVAAWLDAPGTSVIEVDGTFAVPVAGGRVLAESLRDAREVERRLRRDSDALERRKVRSCGRSATTEVGLVPAG
jgi:DNA polymerase-3 subunit epsilon